jgi:diguanylate cyclase (GGDEF)-like protein
MLGDEYIVHQAVDGRAGWEILQDNTAISVVFTDMQMPVMTGLELLANIRESDDEYIANLPVIIITGQGDSEETKQEVFDHGATDFIAKPFGSIDLLSRARAYAQLNRKVVELEQQTGHDKLTGLFNEASLEEQGDKALAFAFRHRLNISTVYLQIDGFQSLFLDQGKAVAQQIIVAVAKRLAGVLRTEDVAARMGVAKFGVLLPLTNSTQAKITVDRIRESINKLVFDTGKAKLRIVLAAGMTSPDLGEELKYADMMAQADIALTRALEKAGDKIASYVEEIDEIIELRPVATEDDLKRAFELILEEDYFKIERDHMNYMVERLAPFLAYVEDLENENMSNDDVFD